MSTRLAPHLVMIVTALAAAACQGSAASTPVAMHVGESRALGEGSARSWVSLAADGTPRALGITLTEAALDALESGGAGGLTLRLPTEATAPPFDHIELRWIGSAAEPDAIFERPQLGVHFYLLSPAEREAIRDSAEAAQIPALELIPRSYIPLARLLARAGTHWIDPTAPELNGEPLSGSLLYGFYGGRMSFLEPRIAGALLRSRRELTREIKLPEHYARPGYYPTRYRVRYDADAREYTLALEGLLRRP